jgi:hypothetical protein
MRRFGFFLLSCVVLATGFFPSEAVAMGFGVYGMSGMGDADWEEDSSGLEISMDLDRYGAGVVLEFGNTARDFLNYRVGLGYERTSHDISGVDLVKTDAVVMTHDFGIALIRRGGIKVWAGPELSLSYSKGSLESVSSFDIEMLGVGVGPVVGLDLNHLDSPININFQSGYLFTKYDVDAELGGLSADFSVEESQYFVRVSFIFRLGE